MKRRQTNRATKIWYIDPPRGSAMTAQAGMGTAFFLCMDRQNTGDSSRAEMSPFGVILQTLGPAMLAFSHVQTFFCCIVQVVGRVGS